MADTRSPIDILQEQYFGNNPHESHILNMLPDLLSSVNEFVDVGASLGQYTHAANNVLRNGNIYAIEPDPLRITTLKQNCNTWKSTNDIHVIEGAVSDIDGTIDFYTTYSNLSGSIVLTPINKINHATVITVRSYTLDTLFSDPPDFIKIDVEGGEQKVIDGAMNIVSAQDTTFLIEFHGSVARNLITTILSGYSVHRIDNSHCLYIGRK